MLKKTTADDLSAEFKYPLVCSLTSSIFVQHVQSLVLCPYCFVVVHLSCDSQTNGYLKLTLSQWVGQCAVSHVLGVLKCILVCIRVKRPVACPTPCAPVRCRRAPPSVCEHGTPTVFVFLWWSVWCQFYLSYYVGDEFVLVLFVLPLHSTLLWKKESI